MAVEVDEGGGVGMLDLDGDAVQGGDALGALEVDGGEAHETVLTCIHRGERARPRAAKGERRPQRHLRHSQGRGCRPWPTVGYAAKWQRRCAMRANASG